MTSIATLNSSLSEADTPDENANKFLSFLLDAEEYGVEILRVREIIGIIDITPLPQTPAFVKGVINLRGKIIPVIELRAKFDLEPKPYDEETCVIVVEVSDGASDGTNAEQFQMGVIVDTVSEVIHIPRANIDPAPSFGGSTSTEYILGMGKIKEKVLILLDIDKVMNEEEILSLISSANQSPATPNANAENETAETQIAAA